VSEAGMSLSQNDVVLLSRLFNDYVLNTKEGKQTILKLLGAEVKPADVRHAYYPRGRISPGSRLKHEDLTEYSGYIYKGSVAIRNEQIDVEPRGNLDGCDSTGILGPKGYCIQTVKTYGQGGKETLSSLSNYARMHSEDLNVRSGANAKVCDACPIDACDYHPGRNAHVKLLPPPVVRNG